MAIPTFEDCMLPLLDLASRTNELSMSDAHDALGNYFKLHESEIQETLPSGAQTVFKNRVGWARTYLKKAMAIDSKRRGYISITERGKEILKEKPQKIDNDYLMKYKEFVDFKLNVKDKSNENVEHKLNSKEKLNDKIQPKDIKNNNYLNKTPQEILEENYQKLQQELSDEILKSLKSCSPSFFERLVVDVLVNMGYGGTRKDAGQALGKSGDEGIDGIIKEDRLGLDIIYIQAKRWDRTVVGRPEIQKFVGALQGFRARKGIFITTSEFTREAEEYVSKIESKIILINGRELANYMIEYNIGTSPVFLYEVKKIDSDYFNEDL